MDFIERLFGISPDGGSGSTEAMYVLTLVAVLLVLWRRPVSRAIRRRIGRRALAPTKLD